MLPAGILFLIVESCEQATAYPESRRDLLWSNFFALLNIAAAREGGLRGWDSHFDDAAVITTIFATRARPSRCRFTGVTKGSNRFGQVFRHAEPLS